MQVVEILREMIEFNNDSEVMVLVKTNDEDYEESIDTITLNRYGEYVFVEVDLKGKVLIDEDELDHLERKAGSYDELLEEIRNNEEN